MTDNPERAQPSVPEMQREYAGSWLAMKDGVVVDARRAPYELVSALTAVWHSYGIEVEAPNPDADIIHTRSCSSLIQAVTSATSLHRWTITQPKAVPTSLQARLPRGETGLLS